MRGRALKLRAAAFALFVVSACGTAVDSTEPDDPVGPNDVEAGADDAAPDEGADARTREDASSSDAPSDAPRDVSTDVIVVDGSVSDSGDAGPVLPPPQLTVGAADRILLSGIVVTPDTSFSGMVLVEGGLITCVDSGFTCSGMPGANGATVIATNGIIAPGMIDTHNHILFDIFDETDWAPARLYTNHDDWPKELKYQAMLDVKQCLEDASQGKPAWCPATYDGTGSLKCEMDKWGELKGMIAGTTSIVGLPGSVTGACFGSLSRSIDVAQNDLDADRIQTSALFPPSDPTGVCANFTSGNTHAFLAHVGEGTDTKSRNEWTSFSNLGGGCLISPKTTITHGTAFTANEFATMGSVGMKLTWSPASNVSLYGTTTNIPLALDANVTIALAPDWSMGGSQNLLDEMRFAAAWDDAHFGNRLTAKDIVLMTTKNAASVVARPNELGELAVGKIADIVVYSPLRADPWEAIVAAQPKDVRMTMIGGKILYGDTPIQAAAPALPGCETMTICGASKFLCVAENTAANKLGQTYAQIKAILEAALVDVDSLTPLDGWNFAPLAPIVKCNP